jgi:hypothetical protein
MLRPEINDGEKATLIDEKITEVYRFIYLDSIISKDGRWLRTLLLHPNLFKASVFTLSQDVPISFKSFFMTSSHPRRGSVFFSHLRKVWKNRKTDLLTKFIILEAKAFGRYVKYYQEELSKDSFKYSFD